VPVDDDHLSLAVVFLSESPAKASHPRIRCFLLNSWIVFCGKERFLDDGRDRVKDREREREWWFMEGNRVTL
jgi:hypothetical protein